MLFLTEVYQYLKLSASPHGVFVLTSSVRQTAEQATPEAWGRPAA